MRGNKDPSGSGHYDKDGKWIRTQIKPTYDPTGRFNIGTDFVSGSAAIDLSDSAKPQTIAGPAESISKPADIYCAVCSITVSAKSEMAKHLSGIKHAKKLKATGASPPPPPQQQPLNDTIARSVMKAGIDGRATGSVAAIAGDMSIFRTPSGKYYCRRCDSTIEDAHAFGQHLQSKKHARAVSPKRETTTTTTAERR